MGKIATDKAISDALDALRPSNPSASVSSMIAYATAFLEYEEADNNIREHGTIVFHPRSGAPIQNPYLAIRADAQKRMQKERMVKGDALWRRLDGEAVAP